MTQPRLKFQQTHVARPNQGELRHCVLESCGRPFRVLSARSRQFFHCHDCQVEYHKRYAPRK